MFFIPYKDDNPTRSFAWINWAIILGNIWVFFAYQFPLGTKEQIAYFSNFGFIPFAFFKQFAPLNIGEAAWGVGHHFHFHVQSWRNPSPARQYAFSLPLW